MRVRSIAALFGGFFLAGAPPAAAQGGTPYDELTNTHRAVTNFNVETTRGVALSSGGHLVAINTHGSLLRVLNPGSSAWDVTAPTLNNPVALGTYAERIEDGERHLAVVLCAGSHVLALQDLADGTIRDLLQLPAEPGDLVVDPDNHRCFVSIPGNNTCMQVALPSLRVDAIFRVASQRPRYLNLDRGDLLVPSDNRVHVTPELSGNNSISHTARDDSFLPGFGALGNASFDNIDALDLSGDLPEGLPDEDLFRLDPQPAASGTPPVVDAVGVLRNVGTLLFAHGRNPANGAYWIVGTDSKNTLATDEPSLKGIFTENRLTIAPTIHTGPAVAFNTLPYTNTTVDLDLVGGGYAAGTSISMPTGLTFHPTGFAVICGVASDRIRVTDTLGARVGEQLLDDGSIPRHVLFTDDGLLEIVYLWGSNEVRVYDATAVLNAILASSVQQATPTDGLLATLDLGVDPTPEAVARGREIFYDASRSQDGRSTCGHCHPGGGMDLLGWNIRDFPHDHKDLMVTQSLKAIEDTFPYHWRGERDLEAFNGAFEGLLGGVRLTTDTTDPALVAAGLSTDTNGIDGDELSEFEDFKAFVFSLQVHANPHEHLTRTLVLANATPQHFLADPGGGLPGVPSTGSGDPAAGQLLMDTPATLLGRFSCADCHGKVAGTVGDPQMDDLGTIPGNRNMDVAHFRQLFHKTQDLVPIQFNFAPIGLVSANVPRGGFGLSHDGNHASPLDFLLRNPFALNAANNDHQNLASFVQQADEGITPAAHVAYRVDPSTVNAVDAVYNSTLLPQAGASFTAAHWLSLAIVGRHEDASGVTHDLRWYYLPAAGAYIPSDRTLTFPNGTVGSQTWADLVKQVRLGKATFVLLGLPPGNSIRWAVDRDDDLLDDTDEVAWGSNPLLDDSDGDGDLDGHEATNGGNPTNAGVQSSDSAAPFLLYARVDHTGSNYAKLVLWFSEPCSYSVTATSGTSGSQVERRFDAVWYDTVTVQRLVPSIPSMTINATSPLPSVAAVPNTYTFTVTMTDLAGNTSTTGIVASDDMRDQLVLLPFGFSVVGGTPNVPPAFLSRVVSSLAWNGTPSGTSFTADVSVAHRYTATEVANMYLGAPNTPNQSSSPVDQQVVVAQVIHEDAAGNRTILPMSGAGLTVSSPSGLLFPTVEVVLGGGTTPLDLPGPFLVSSTTGPAGTATLDFDLSAALGAGEKVHLNVIGIFEQALLDGPQPANVFWVGSVAVYNKPATAPEQRAIQFP